MHLPRIILVLLCTAVAIAQPAKFDAQISQHLAAAQVAEQAQNYAAAGREYQEILKLQPNLAQVRQSLALTLHLQNRFPEAIAEFQRALRLDPKLWGSELFLGMDYYKTNQFALGLTALKASIALNAKMAEPEARFWLGVSYLALNRPEEAISDLRRDLELRSRDVEVLYYLSKAYDQSASKTFERIGAIEPDAAAVPLLQAERLLDENRKDLAAPRYRTAVQLRPDFASWIPTLAGDSSSQTAVPDVKTSAADAQRTLEWASLLTDAGDASQTKAVLRNLVSQKPKDDKAAALIALASKRLAAPPSGARAASLAIKQDIHQGIGLMEQGRFSEAQAPLSRAGESAPNAVLQFLLIRSYVESGDSGKAEDHLRRLLTKQPDNIDALLLLGRTYKRQAEKTLQSMIQIDPDCYGVHELLGKQHEEKTEYDTAIQEYQAALAKRPDAAGIRYAIGNVYRKMSRYDDAETFLSDELRANPYHALAHYRLGSIYVEQGKAEAAIPHLQQALQFRPQLTDAQLDLGRAYTATGKYEEARQMLDKVIAADPQNDRVHYLLSLVYTKENRRQEAQTELALYQRLTRERLQRTQKDIKSVADSLEQ